MLSLIWLYLFSCRQLCNNNQAYLDNYSTTEGNGLLKIFSMNVTRFIELWTSIVFYVHYTFNFINSAKIILHSTTTMLTRGMTLDVYVWTFKFITRGSVSAHAKYNTVHSNYSKDG